MMTQRDFEELSVAAQEYATTLLQEFGERFGARPSNRPFPVREETMNALEKPMETEDGISQ